MANERTSVLLAFLFGVFVTRVNILPTWSAPREPLKVSDAAVVKAIDDLAYEVRQLRSSIEKCKK